MPRTAVVAEEQIDPAEDVDQLADRERPKHGIREWHQC
jgi:hypothetical protein